MSFDLDEDDDEGQPEVFELALRDNERTLAALNDMEIDHVISEEGVEEEEMKIELSTAEDFNAAITFLTDKLGSEAFPEGVWPEPIIIGNGL